MAEICIPKSRVPDNILNILQEIGQQYQAETCPRADEVDCGPISYDERDDVVHVTSVGLPFQQTRTKSRDDDDTVHIFEKGMGRQSQQLSQLRHDQQLQQQQQSTASSGCQSNQQHFKAQQLSRVTTTSHGSHFASSEDRVSSDGNVQTYFAQSPGKLTGRAEKASQNQTPMPQQENPSSPLSKAASTTLTSRGRAGSTGDDDIVRVFPSCTSAIAPESKPPSPKMLTPPETPEDERKTTKAEIFTFDEITCGQELLRQGLERMRHIPDAYAPTRDPTTLHPTTPRHPATPTLRNAEVPRSPIPLTPSRHPPTHTDRNSDVPRSPAPVCRQSPADQALSRLDGPPLQFRRRLNSDLSTSPNISYHSQHGRGSLSPPPRKRLNFDDDRIMQPGSISPKTQTHPNPSFRLKELPGIFHPNMNPRQTDLDRSGFLLNEFCLNGYQVNRANVVNAGKNATGIQSSQCFQERVGSNTPHSLGVANLFERDETDGQGARYLISGRRSDNWEDTSLQAENAALKRKRPSAEYTDDGYDDLAVCSCAVMERNFLQMAECAYKRIRRRDSSSSDFERFRNELAQTNDILRQSMALIKHIREICNHQQRLCCKNQ